MMCESCAAEAAWLILTPGVEYIGRVCHEHLTGVGADAASVVVGAL